MEKLFQTVSEKIKRVAPRIVEKQTAAMEKGPLWQRIVFSALYKIIFPMIPKMNRKFWADEKCNRCGICT